MTACQLGHLDCVDYLVSAGADPTLVTQNCRYETALHLAAQHAHSSCITRLLDSQVVDENGAQSRLAPAIVPGNARFVDSPNGAGMSALHLATLNGSSSTVRALVRAGAALDSQMCGGRSRPASNWMCAGSTALHLASARGFPNIAAILLDAQATNPGATDLRRIRNSRGLKPSQCARLEGHHDLARLLHAAPSPPGLPPRRSRRAAAELRAAAPSLEALMQLLVARAKLLLSLRSIVLQQKGQAEAEAGGQQEAAVVPAAPPGPNAVAGRTACPAVDILHLLASLEVPPQQMAGAVTVSATAETASGGDVVAPSRAAAQVQASGRAHRSYAAAALMQAALDAIELAARTGPDGLVPDRVTAQVMRNDSWATAADAAASTAASVAADVSGGDATTSTADSAPAAAVAAEAVPPGVNGVARPPAAEGVPRRRRHQRVLSSTSHFLQDILQMNEPIDGNPSDLSWVPAEASSPGLLVRWRQRQSRRRRRFSHPEAAAAAATVAAIAAGPASTPVLSTASSPVGDSRTAASRTAAAAAGNSDGRSAAAEAPRRLGSRSSAASVPAMGRSRSDASINDAAADRGADFSILDGQPLAPPSPSASRRSFFVSSSNSSVAASPTITAAPPAGSGNAASSRRSIITPTNSVNAAPAEPRLIARVGSVMTRAASRGSLRRGSSGGDIQPAMNDEIVALADSPPDSPVAGSPQRSADSVSSADSGDDDSPIDLKPIQARSSGWTAGSKAGPSSTSGEAESCAICMDRGEEVAIGGCGHGLCVRCAYQLCARGLQLPSCPFCRATINSFEPAGAAAGKQCAEEKCAEQKCPQQAALAPSLCTAGSAPAAFSAAV